MELPKPIVEGKLLGRRKRFFADVELPSGEVVAHCPNPGSMRGNAEPGSKVWLWDTGADHLERGRKLRYRWLLVESRGAKVCVDTNFTNPFVQKLLETNQIPELSGYEEIIPEFTVDESRFDFLLLDAGKAAPCVVEVKSVSMFESNIGYFPDSVTLRGQKHLIELAELACQGIRTVMFFVVQRSGLQEMRPADEIDAAYGAYLRDAIEHGVEVLVYDISLGTNGIVNLGKKLELVTNVD